MSIGNIPFSFASAKIETSISLFQFNFDFTIKKNEAPAEYNSVGRALSLGRRQNAENGTAHRTARKLDWLFQQIVPHTPLLLKAYGLRVSEILKRPDVNPIGSAADGPFQDYVGVDCTSLWAAATSGPRPWACIYLLAEGNVISESSVTAARQDFSRKELASWDASARAWLVQADRALEPQRDQFLLIVKNISLSTGSNKSPAINVIAAWDLAMRTMETHLEGISQQVSDGAVLFAISSWHMYPNLIHFGRTAQNVTFSDMLFTKPATMTLGLNEFKTSQENRGIHWSLALSHLRYYGDPVPVESVEDRTRASPVQFKVIVLGGVLESWRVSRYDRLDAVRWIHELWKFLQETTIGKQIDMRFSPITSWLQVLGSAANDVLSATSTLFARYEDCLGFGETWADEFLSLSESQPPPYFGLCNPSVMKALSEPLDVDAGIQYLRHLAHKMGLNEDEAIICYSQQCGELICYEYCTAVEHRSSFSKPSHARWIGIDTVSSKAGNCGSCEHVCHQLDPQLTKITPSDLDTRLAMLKAQGEQGFRLEQGSIVERLVYSHRVATTKAKIRNKTIPARRLIAPYFNTCRELLVISRGFSKKHTWHIIE